MLNFIENKGTVQFIHRALAYVIFITTVLYTINLSRLTKMTPAIRKTRYIPLVLVTVQVLLGIIAVLTSPGIIPNQWGQFEWVAQFHQLTAMLFMLSLVTILYLTNTKSFMQLS